MPISRDLQTKFVSTQLQATEAYYCIQDDFQVHRQPDQKVSGLNALI